MPKSIVMDERDAIVSIGERRLLGALSIPESPKGVVLFAHGSGSGRNSPRNRFVASELSQAGFATFLLDLLDPEEAEEQDKVFDSLLLARRLLKAAEWLRKDEDTRGLPIGLFGASTGAAAALLAAAMQSDFIAAVVSRGGRPDLVLECLHLVRCPTLLMVGADDEPVVTWNREAYAALKCRKELAVIPGATHLVPEPGALEESARRARVWCSRFLSAQQNSEHRVGNYTSHIEAERKASI